MYVKKTDGKDKGSNANENPVSFDERDLLSGKDGIVWGTYDLKQSEIIQNALLAQDIHSEINRSTIKGKELFVIIVSNQADVTLAIDFIWRCNTGLRLKPDWSYPIGENNNSFERWLGVK